MAKDPYRVLGVSPGASEDEVKAAYRRLAKECHPDLHPNDPNAAKRMNELNEAYDAIRNPSHAQSSTYSDQNATGRNPYQQSGYGSYGGYGGNPYGSGYGTNSNQNRNTENNGWGGFYGGWGQADGENGESGENPFEEIFRQAYEQQARQRQRRSTGRISLGKIILIALLVYLFFSTMSRFFGADPYLDAYYYAPSQNNGGYSYQQPEEEGAADNGAQQYWYQNGTGAAGQQPYGGTGPGNDPNPFGASY